MMVKLSFPENPDFKTALRYLGARNQATDASMQALLETSAEKLRMAAVPRAVWQQTDASSLGEEPLGSDLEKHLAGCESVVLMAATLGAGADAALRHLSASDLAMAVSADALASAVMEQICDDTEKNIRKAFAEKGLFVTGRYSPGYGDCPLTLQTRLCNLLDTSRKIGLSATDQNLLLPRKSVTAILGVSKVPVKGYRAGCAHCKLKETCSYRERGITCETEL